MDMLYVAANAVSGGRRAGLSATLGIMAGGVVHTVFGTAVVGVLMRKAPWAFTLLIFAGAAYMVWIGINLLRSSNSLHSTGEVESRSCWTCFRRGAVTCLLNPKAYLFCFTVYPQFLRPQYGSLWSQAAVMGAMTLLIQFGVYGGLAFAIGKSRDLLHARPGTIMLVTRAAGCLFVVVAVLTAWHGWADGQFPAHL
jgi:threonine/homoserine/homoserine lactone efflux protein